MTMLSENGKLSITLKGVCEKYVADYLQEDFAVSSYGESLFSSHPNKDVLLPEDIDEGDYILAMDRFILFGKTLLSERRVLDAVMSAKGYVSKEGKKILAEWRDRAFESVFEVIQSLEGGFHVIDIVAEVEYDVYGNDPKTFAQTLSMVQPGYFLFTRIAPVRGMWFFSGTQTPLPLSMEDKIFETVILQSPPEAQYRNNPEKRERSFAMQKEHYDHFVSHFGTDELMIPGKMVAEKEYEFYRSWTQSIGGDPKTAPKPPAHFGEELQDEEGAGLLMDAQDGFYTIMGYGEFRAAFLDSIQSKKQRANIIKESLAEDTIPALCFRRMRERYPEQFREAITLALPEFVREHDPLDDFSVLMDEYKPGWRNVSPSVYVVNERFRKRYYDRMDIGRNDPCPCGEKKADGRVKKYKHCCGK